MELAMLRKASATGHVSAMADYTPPLDRQIGHPESTLRLDTPAESAAIPRTIVIPLASSGCQPSMRHHRRHKGCGA